MERIAASSLLLSIPMRFFVPRPYAVRTFCARFARKLCGPFWPGTSICFDLT